MNKRAIENGSILLSTLCTILIISIIGANVLFNCTTRYNATSKQVKAWKEALIAAEAGGDVGYAVCRKTIGDPNYATVFANDGWTIPSPAPANPTWTKAVAAFGEAGSLSANVTVDRFFTDTNGTPHYRIRSTGTARVFGLKRAGMDDRVSQTTRGDSLLRKIDFAYDHFKASYGDGDSTAGTVAIASVPYPQISRRVELIAVPLDAFDAAVKCLAAFWGPGSASVVDSYDSHNLPPAGTTTSSGSYYYFAANNPNDPNYADARNGNVAVDTPSFSEGGPIYGDVSTNGGNVTHSGTQISGTIDNNVAFTLPPITQPSPPLGQTWQSGSPSTINPTATATSSATPDWYLYSNYDNVTIHAQTYTDPVTHVTSPVETYVNVVVTQDVGGNSGSQMTVDKGVNLKLYFKGNFAMKASRMDNNNVDGATGVLMPGGGGYVQSTSISRAAHVQFYGINPTAPATQNIDTNPGGSGGSGGAQMWCTFYAPGADFNMNGNPDLFGAVVCKTFYGNGNCGFHYDKALKAAGVAVEYRVASYVEDIR